MNRIPKIMSVIIRNLVYYSQCDWSLSRYHLMVSGRGILYDRLTHTPPHPHTFLACLIPVWLNIILHPLSTMPWFWPVMGWVWKAKAPLTERCRFESLTLLARLTLLLRFTLEFCIKIHFEEYSTVIKKLFNHRMI